MNNFFFQWMNIILWLILIMIIFYLIMMLKLMHPMIFNLLLILYSIILTLNLSIYSLNYIYSMILFLIMISGMLIIFMYFSSTISNEKFYKFFNWIYIYIIIFFMFLNFTLIKFTLNLYTNKFYEISPLFLYNKSSHSNIIMIYDMPFFQISLLCMIYLLFSLIIIIKISTFNSKPLRKILTYE